MSGPTLSALALGFALLASSGARSVAGMRLSAQPTGRPVLYMSFPTTGAVNIYATDHPNKGPISTITGLQGPSGLAVDPSGNLWVYGSNGISGFRRGGKAPFVTLGVPAGFEIAVDHSGRIYAATTYHGIIVYAQGSWFPVRTVYDPWLYAVWGVAVDSKGDIFCDGYEYVGSSQQVPRVDELPAHATAWRRLNFQPDVSGALSVGKRDALVVQDAGSQNIAVYAPPYDGPPVSLFSYPEGLFLGSEDIALSPDGDDVWTPFISPQGESSAIKYELTTGKQIYQTEPMGHLDALNGVAIDPAFFP